ncbi:S8 family serine peptidase [Cytobacillus dafuensis]|uniref:S8 family serine peptidase n=1 Tax=Cytobacillus dafuensis TaxID=1742359 RepID=A0A5B8Z5G9_CYTDA|nr:S8 family serine peptidase [Cytobacillus dafuensis]QED48137.1 S8 family serine peptidase [Cytobacillus dafuensis]
MEINSLIKKAAAVAFSAGLIISPIHSVLSTEAVAQELKAEDILLSLTKEQREALHQLQLNDHTGLQGFSEADLETAEEVSVIVEFKSKPGKVAVLEAEFKGKTLKNEDAEAQVEKEHKIFKEDIKKYLPQENSKAKSNSNSITQTFKKAYNGVAMKLPGDKVKLLLESDVVQAVYKDETFTVDPIKQDLPKDVDREITTSVESIPYLKIDKLHEEGITGDGVKVAVLDTGIDYNHPDLKDAYKGGYDFVDNDNDPMETTYADWEKSNQPEYAYGTAYYTSHGTHVSGTIAGQNKNDSEVSVVGVAPDADLYVYRVLGPYGSGTSEAVIAGIEKAVEDGMDVMNLSLGASINNPYFPTSTAINYAVLNGVTAVVSAGNSGPNSNTVGSPGTAALALTIGASDVPVAITSFTGSISGNWSTELISMGRSFADDFSALNGQSLELVDVGFGSQEEYTEKDVKGKIAFVQRGNLALNDKIKFAKEHGAKAVIMYNNVDGQIGVNLGESHVYVPAFSITKEAGEKFKANIAQGNTAFTFSNMKDIVSEGDKLADFSSRGPVNLNYDMKPEVVAPGVSVLSTFPSYMIDHENQEDYKYAYARLSGTSMAAPHTAGIAALLLEANPKLDPDDIKTVLMNTADPLNGSYSLYEAGAGRVDPYQAIHGQMKMQVTDETDIPDGEYLEKFKNPSGDINFGIHFGAEGSNVRANENISFTNNSNSTKNFSVSIEENAAEGTNSLSKNGIAVSTSKNIKVKANQEVKQNVFLTAPKTAKAGRYEGFVVLTNKADSSDQYRIPFNFRITKDGISSLDLLRPIISPEYLNQAPLRLDLLQNVATVINLGSPGKTMDVTLQDGETGKDLGLIGTLDLTGAPLDKNLLILAFNGRYYSFTGDSKQPIAEEVSYAKPGHYKLNFVTTSQTGKVTKETRDIYIKIDDPTFTSSLDGPSPFVEYKQGQATYPFEVQLLDPLMEEMQNNGVKLDQSANTVIYTWGNIPFPSSPIRMDKDGKWAEEVAMEESIPALRFTLSGYDAAANTPLTKEYFFVKEGTPVTYAKSDIKKVKTGETIKAQLFLDNVSDAKEVIWNLKEQYKNDMDLIDAKLAEEFSDKGTILVNGDEVKVVFNDANVTFDQAAVVDVTLKINDETFTTKASITPTATVKNSQSQSSNLLNAGYAFEISPQFNAAFGYVLPDGFRNPANGLYDRKDWTKVGASLKFKESSGYVFDATSLIKVGADYRVEKLPLSKDPYILEIKIPGHFEVQSKQNLSFEYKGELFGRSHYVSPIKIKAGDVNQDNVIDVLDAIDIQKAWKTDNRAADINFDGMVDAKDIGFVKDNYLLQNKYVDNPPAPKENHEGKTLESILKELGIQ